jgi:hypothetical protein
MQHGKRENMMESEETWSGTKYKKGGKEQRDAEDVRKKKTLEFKATKNHHVLTTW